MLYMLEKYVSSFKKRKEDKEQEMRKMGITISIIKQWMSDDCNRGFHHQTKCSTHKISCKSISCFAPVTTTPTLPQFIMHLLSTSIILHQL